MFFKDDVFFSFPKKLGKENAFFMVDKTKQKLLFENYECFSKKKKNVKSLFLLKTFAWAPCEYRYSLCEPGFDQSI